MFLSRVVISSRDAAMHKLSDPGAWHRQLWACFPGRPDAKRDFLFRVEHREGGLQVLLLSNIRPTIPTWGQWQTKAVAETFLDHDFYIFQLLANPTIKRVVRDEQGNRRKNGRRTGIYSMEELKAWIERKASDSGFKLVQLQFEPPVDHVFLRGPKKVKYTGVEFKGILKVIDHRAFQDAFVHGIGPAKAFGFGMLVVKPVDFSANNKEEL